MEINFQVEGRHAVLTLSSSAPANAAMLCVALEWNQPMPPWRSLHERNAIAAALTDLSRLIGATPMVLDLGPRQPLHERRPTTRAMIENASTSVSVASRGSTS